MLTIETLYSHTFTVSRPTRTADGQGGWAVGYVEIGEIRGRLRPLGSSERTVADQQQARVTHVLYCPADSDIQRGDLVSGAGQTVEVIAVREPSHAGHHWEVDCMETQTDGGGEAGS
jgi:head-tail adaptor